MERQILHVDVNNAFLSWTAISLLKKGSNLDIRTIPAIIGGDESKRRGIVLAKSPIAKELGIKTAEPIYFAKQKCPDLQIFPSDFTIYRHYSNLLYQLLLEYTEKVERFSIDECFLDMTDYLGNRTIFDVAKEISQRVKKEFGFTVNIGIATNKLLAKMASDFQKPDKIHTLFPQEIPTKMWVLPVSELFMVGKKTIPKLERMGIRTIGDLAKQDKTILIHKFGKFGKVMWEYANGIDASEVISQEEEPKGIGNSITLPKDIQNIEELSEVLLALAEQVAFRLRKQNKRAYVVNVQLKTKDFISYSHQKKLEVPTDSTKTIGNVAKALLQESYKGEPIRLIGVRVDNLCSKKEIQLSLFDTNKEKQEKLDQTIDKLKEKYGYNTITIAGKMNLNDRIRFK